MTTSRTKLSAALRSRFKNPRDVLKALGVPRSALDADLVDVGKPSAGGGNNDALMKMRDDIEGLLGKLGLSEGGVKAMLEVLDQHAPSADTRLPDDDEYAGEVRAIAGDVDEEAVQKFRALLRGKMSDAEIDEALALAAGAVPGEAKDRLPVHAAGKGGFGGYGHGTKVVGDERKRAAYDRMFGSEVIVGIEYGPDRSRGRSVAWPSSLDDYNKRFGGEHIG